MTVPESHGKGEQRHSPLSLADRAALIMPDPEPPYEWRREELCDD